MGRELWSQAGEPTWAIDERLRRLEDRVDQLAAVVAELVAQQAAQELAAAEPAADRPGVTGPGVTEPVGSSGRTTGVRQPCRSHPAPSDGGGAGGAR